VQELPDAGTGHFTLNVSIVLEGAVSQPQPVLMLHRAYFGYVHLTSSPLTDNT
jgi:hypothetical protein